MRSRRNLLSDIDWISIILYVVLVAMGYLSIYAADYDATRSSIIDFSHPHGKQVIWIALSFVLAGLILIIDSKFFTTFAYVMYGAVLLLLLLVLGAGSTINGNKAWLQLGGFSLQPAEFAKFATCLALSKFMSGLGVNLKNLSTRLILGGMIALPVALILAQGDAGSAIVFSVFILVLYREGLPAEILIVGFAIAVLSVLALLLNKIYLIIALAAIALVLIVLFRRNRRLIFFIVGGTIIASAYVFSVNIVVAHLKPHQINRINVLLGKDTDTKGVGYNVNQSKITIGSGGLTGKGFLNGTQTKGNFVPEQITDFIFCTVGEEHGFAGTFLVLALYFGLLVRIVFIAERQRSKFSRLYGYGVACILFFHITINVGMTIGLVPVVGIPLPFFSYGGSSIIAFTALLFVLLKLDGERLAVLR